ncbi:uncharacterized protein LOC120344284 [Styela clava]
MSRTKLVKLGPQRSQLNCRNRRQAKVQNTKKRKKRIVVPCKGATWENLNPEKMIVIREEDKKYFGLSGIGFRPTGYIDIDYEVAKYHQKLVCSGSRVNAAILSNKAVELCLKAGLPLTLYNATSGWIQYFLKRCACVRAHLQQLRSNEASFTEDEETVQTLETPLCKCSKPNIVPQQPASLLNLFATPASPEPTRCRNCSNDDLSSDSGVSSMSTSTTGASFTDAAASSVECAKLFIPESEVKLYPDDCGLVRTDTAVFRNPRTRLHNIPRTDSFGPKRLRYDYFLPEYCFPELLPSGEVKNFVENFNQSSIDQNYDVDNESYSNLFDLLQSEFS